MSELDGEESWAPKNWCFWTVVLEKTLESPLDCKEIQPVHPKGDQSWVFIGRADIEAETPILWPPHAKSCLIGKDPDAGKDWGQEEKGMTEDEMAGWHHRLSGHGFGWTLGVGDGQQGLACCSSQGHKELDTTDWLNWTESVWSQKQLISTNVLGVVIRKEFKTGPSYRKLRQEVSELTFEKKAYEKRPILLNIRNANQNHRKESLYSTQNGHCQKLDKH